MREEALDKRRKFHFCLSLWDEAVVGVCLVDKLKKKSLVGVRLL